MKKTARIAASIVFILTFALYTANGQDETHTVNAGERVEFLATAQSETPVTFTWYKNEIALGVVGPKYIINSVTENDAGIYSVIATNENGSTPSNKLTVKLIVLPPKKALDRHEVIGLWRELRSDYVIAKASSPKFLKYSQI